MKRAKSKGDLTKRRRDVITRLNLQVVSGTKNTKDGQVPLTPADITRITEEVKTLHKRLGGEKKKKAAKVVKGIEKQDCDKWFIDIYSISFSRVKRSDRRKNKGKSRKKARSVRTKTFLKSVVCQAGSIQAYREGRMGLSQKTHSFSLRKEVTYEY